MANPIGVFGGMFDPVHNGHLATAFLAREHFHLDRIMFVPAGVAPHKLTTVTASPADRLTMLQIALANESEVEIWEKEAVTAEVSYTIYTLKEIINRFPGQPVYFIVGADNLNEIPTWHKYREVLAEVTLCVTGRPGYSMQIPSELSGADIRTFPSPCWGISSTKLRSYLAQGLRCRHLIPDGVYDYIDKNKLYRTCTSVPAD